MQQSQSQSSAPPVSNLAEMIGAYAPIQGRFDEMIDESGAVRPHWNRMVEGLSGYDREGLRGLRREVDNLVRDYGMVYNAHSATQGTDRPWKLDLLPVVLPNAEWSEVEAGLSQRLSLLNMILEDTYGARRLIHERIVPPEFLFANPSFLRQCHHMPTPRTGHILRYAADLVRGPDGKWCVFSDRTQSPGGVGYTLENRIVIGRTIPQVLNSAHAHRLAGFFTQFRDKLFASSPERHDVPTVVLLTPGPNDSVHFEHVFLARYLGFDVVEGEDLTTRDNRLFLRTIAGLRQVDVVLRRVDDDGCDPLEFQKPSSSGIVGFLQAIRHNHVAVCNAIGSGTLENHAVAAVLPALCRFYLGEELKINSVPTWWGGDPAHRDYIEQNFESLRIVPAFRHNDVSTFDPNRSKESDLEKARKQFQAAPHQFVGIDVSPPSTIPVWTDNGLQARGLTVRAFALAGKPGQGATVLPGGLGRYIKASDHLDLGVQVGLGTKDVWVTADGPVEYQSLLQPPEQIATVRRSPDNVTSRLAENLLWLGRYCERTESNLRLLRHLLMRCVDEEDLAFDDELRRLVIASAHLFDDDVVAMAEAAKVSDGATVQDQVRNAVLDAVYSTTRPDTIASTIVSLRRTAWVAREHFSDDDWRILNSFTHEFLSIQQLGRREIGSTFYSLNQVLTGLSAFSGLVHENMTREPGRVFIQLGRRLERATFTAELLMNAIVLPLDDSVPLLRSLLAICDSPMTYRSRYGGLYQVPLVLDLLIVDESNPRSIAFQIRDLSNLLQKLPRDSGPSPLKEEERIVMQLRTAIQTASVYDLATASADNELPLQALLNDANENLLDLSDALSHRYFIHTAAAQQTGAIINTLIE